MFIQILLITVGAFLILDTIFVSRICNMNLGVTMPAVIGAPLLILGIFYDPLLDFFASGVFGAIIMWVAIAAYAAFTLLFITTTSLILISAAKKPKNTTDVLIVLGAALRDDRATRILLRRLDKAYEYLCDNPNTLCIVSGAKKGKRTVSEAHVMKNNLIELGIAPERIIEETQAKSTYENFLYSDKIIKNKFKRDVNIVFVTTRFHIFRSYLTARAANVRAYGIPAKGVWYVALNDYLRECAAITRYYLEGKL